MRLLYSLPCIALEIDKLVWVIKDRLVQDCVICAIFIQINLIKITWQIKKKVEQLSLADSCQFLSSKFKCASDYVLQRNKSCYSLSHKKDQWQ